MSSLQMRSSFESILKKYGHDVFLQRRSQTTTDRVTFSETLEVHTVRYSVINSRSLTNKTQEQMEGLVSTSERIYYFKADVDPYDGDRIYETEGRTENRQSVWSIDAVAAMRGTNGEIIYYVASVTRIQPN